MAGLVRLLGMAPEGSAEVVRLAMAGIAGPALLAHRALDCVAFAQAEPAGPRVSQRAEAARQQALHQVQRRLEAACLAGPFLPTLPAAALCPAAELPSLLEAAAPRLRLDLADHAALHQWQLTLRWPTEALLLPHRDSLAASPSIAAEARAAQLADTLATELACRALEVEAGLASVTLALRRLPPVGEAELAFIMLVPRGEEARLEAALTALPKALAHEAVAEMRGPLPPVSFHAWQVAEAEEQALRTAWKLMGLPDRVDTESLRRRRRDRAGRPAGDGPLMPGSSTGAELAEMQGAYRLLAPLVDKAGGADLASLLPRARRRLVPAEGSAA